MFFLLLFGFILGVITILLVQFLYFFVPFGPAVEESFPQQFTPFRIPFELKQILISPNRDEQLRKKESCVSVNLLLQFLYQEFRDSKPFRRWMLKKLQMEFNELLSRSATGKLVKDIKLRSVNSGHQFPVIKKLHAENVKLSDDDNSFETLDLILDVEYRGGFELSVDVVALLGQQASLSVNITKLAGEARLQLNRHPYSHWSLSFVKEPVMDFKVDSKFHGRPLPQLVPLIINQFRRTVRKRHVLPAYKLRFRPFFHNPLFQPSSDPNDFSHISMLGCLKLTVLRCSRLNLSVLPADHAELYCVVMTVVKPHVFGQQSTNFVSIAIKFMRYSASEAFGLTLGREFIVEKGSKQIAVIAVEKGSVADGAGFQTGDLILAVNNICIMTERQAAKLLSNTVGEMVVIVERELSKIDNEDEVMDQLSNSIDFGNVVGSHQQQNGVGGEKIKAELNSDGFIHVSYDSPSVLDECSTGKTTLLKARSFVDLPKINDDTNITDNGNTPPPLVNVEQSDDVADDQNCNASSGLRKVRSVTVLAAVPSSNDVGGGFSSTNAKQHRNSTGETKSIDSSVGLEFIALPSADAETISQASSSADSPHLSRKQRIAERAAQVAQKFSTGKATVKEIIGKRIKRTDGEVTTTTTTSTSIGVQKRKTESSIDGGSQIVITTSKSEEAQLGMRVVNSLSATHCNVSRTRSKSEPDTAVLAVENPSRDNSSSESESVKKEQTSTTSIKDDDKEKLSTGCNEKATPSNEVSTSSTTKQQQQSKKTTVKTFEKSTKCVATTENPEWNECISVPLDHRLKYMNVLVYSKAKSSASSSKQISTDAPTLLGYVNILLPEALDDCSTTRSLCHQQNYALRTSTFPKITPAYQSLSRHPGFDARLCYGDVTLGFQWLPDAVVADDDANNAECPILAKEEKTTNQEPNGEQNQPLLMDGHKWISTHFQHATTCDVCQRKIWLKTAYKCSDCSMISHKKCLSRVSQLGKCGQVPETTARDQQPSSTRDSWNTEEIVEAVEAVAVALESTGTPEHSPASNPSGRRAHLQHMLTEKFAGLRRRRGRGELAGKQDSNGDSISGSPVVLPTLEDVTGGQLNDSPFHSMLYTKGGTYNEHMIYAAKDLGKDLFVDLAVAERKAKINEQIDKLQGEIDAAIQQRLELLTKQKLAAAQNSPHKQQLEQEVTKFDDRLQALAILMLHYCAGLQHCMDIEEANAAAAVAVENSTTSNNEIEDDAAIDVTLELDKNSDNVAEDSVDIPVKMLINEYCNNNVSE